MTLPPTRWLSGTLVTLALSLMGCSSASDRDSQDGAGNGGSGTGGHAGGDGHAAGAGNLTTGGVSNASGGPSSAGGRTGPPGAGGASGEPNETGGRTTSGGSGSSAGGAATSNGGTPSANDGGSAGMSHGNGGSPPGAGGANMGSGGASAGGSAGTSCKRGIAANTAPGAAFFPGVSWWYNWAINGSGEGAGIEFVPMVWGKSTVNSAIPAGSKFLLTFNEPNFHSQSNVTPQDAAALWPALEAKAKSAHVPLVSPAMNFCGPAADCNGTSPYQYLKDFFAACTNCEVDYVAVHWYNCDLPSLKDYLEPGGGLEGFEQFGKPIWLTEFSCNGGASAADQEAFMRKAIPYLEGNTHVYRYSWFSAGPIPNAKLINDDGTPTALGKTYIGLDQSCH